jgi:hypothetical protein
MWLAIDALYALARSFRRHHLPPDRGRNDQEGEDFGRVI